MKTTNVRLQPTYYVVKLLSASLMVLCSVTSAHAASFNCAAASSRIDNAICASPKVSKLDSELEPVYLAVLANSADQNAFKAAQRAWLKDTRNQCQDDACLVTVYQQRIAALSSVAPTSFAEAKANAADEEAADKNLAEETAAASAQAQRVAEQAAAAVSAAQAQKLAEQTAAAAQAQAQAQKIAAESAANQQRLMQIGVGAIALCTLLLFVWFLIRRRPAKAKPVRKQVKTIREPIAAIAEPVQVSKPIDSEPIFPASKSPNFVNPIDKEKALQAMNFAKNMVFSTSSILKDQAFKSSKKLGEEFKQINEARQQTVEDHRNVKGNSKLDNTKALAKSFWTKLTNKQILILIISTAIPVAIFAFIGLDSVDVKKITVNNGGARISQIERLGGNYISLFVRNENIVGLEKINVTCNVYKKLNDGLPLEKDFALSIVGNIAPDSHNFSTPKIAAPWNLSAFDVHVQLIDCKVISAQASSSKDTKIALKKKELDDVRLQKFKDELNEKSDQRRRDVNQDQAERMVQALSMFRNTPNCQLLKTARQNVVAMVLERQKFGHDATWLVDSVLSDAKQNGCL